MRLLYVFARPSHYVHAVAYAREGFGGQNPPPLAMGRDMKTFLFILTIRFCFARN